MSGGTEIKSLEQRIASIEKRNAARDEYIEWVNGDDGPLEGTMARAKWAAIKARHGLSPTPCAEAVPPPVPGQVADDRSIEDRATAAWSTPEYRHLTGPAAMVKFAHSETARLRQQLSDVTGEREAYRTAAMKLEDEVERVKAEMKRTRAEDQRTIQALIVERDEAQRRLKIHEDELARSSAFPKGWKQPKETPAYVAPTTKGGDRPIVTFKDKPRPSPQRRTTGTRGKGGGRNGK